MTLPWVEALLQLIVRLKGHKARWEFSDVPRTCICCVPDCCVADACQFLLRCWVSEKLLFWGIWILRFAAASALDTKAILFFFMMLLLGIDSQFAYVETIATLLTDAGWGEGLPRPALSGLRPGPLGFTAFISSVGSTAGLICFVSYLLGLVFVSRAGIYFLDLTGTKSHVAHHAHPRTINTCK